MLINDWRCPPDDGTHMGVRTGGGESKPQVLRFQMMAAISKKTHRESSAGLT